LLPVLTGQQTVLHQADALLAQCVDHPGRQIQRAAAAVPFEFAERTLPRPLLGDPNPATGKVHVRPAQAEQLTLTHARGQRQRVEGGIAPLSDRFKQLACLVAVERLVACTLEPWSGGGPRGGVSSCLALPLSNFEPDAQYGQ